MSFSSVSLGLYSVWEPASSIRLLRCSMRSLRPDWAAEMFFGAFGFNGVSGFSDFLGMALALVPCIFRLMVFAPSITLSGTPDTAKALTILVLNGFRALKVSLRMSMALSFSVCFLAQLLRAAWASVSRVFRLASFRAVLEGL